MPIVEWIDPVQLDSRGPLALRNQVVEGRVDAGAYLEREERKLILLGRLMQTWTLHGIEQCLSTCLTPPTSLKSSLELISFLSSHKFNLFPNLSLTHTFN